MNFRKNWRSATILLVSVCLVLGLFFRFTNLDRKVYSQDEVFTSLRVSGYTLNELVQDLSQSQIVSVEFFRKYQQASSDKTVADTIQGLAKEEPQLTPLYYGGARLWAEQWGSSVASIRGFSALLSLIALPCMYWLCMELFQSRLTAGIAVILLAVSPVHVLFAQNARHYSLWTATVLLSSATVLWARRRKTALSWSLYAIVLAIDIYTCILSALVAIGQGIYILAVEKFRLSQTVIRYCVASIAAVLLFVPWALTVILNWATVRQMVAMGTTTAAAPSLMEMSKSWLRLPVYLFFDINPMQGTPIALRLMHYGFMLGCAALVLYAIYFLCRTTPIQIWLFVVLLIGLTELALIAQDLILKGQGGTASITPRYFIPSFLGIQIAIAHLLSSQIVTAAKSWQRHAWQTVLAILITASLLSCTLSAQAQVWWDKGAPEALHDALAAAQLINRSPRPLLVTDIETNFLMLYSHLFSPSVHISAKTECSICPSQVAPPFRFDGSKALTSFSDVFLLFRPSGTLAQDIQPPLPAPLKTIALQPQGGTLKQVVKHP